MAKEIGSREQVVIGDNTFYIQNFDPFMAIKVFGDMQKVASPIIAEMTEGFTGGKSEDIMDVDLQSAEVMMRSLKAVCMSMHKYLDGDTLLRVLKMLLDPKIVAVEHNGRPTALNENVVTAVFNGDMMGMLELAYHVIRVNYADVFTTAASRFGFTGGLPVNLSSFAAK